MKLLTSLSLILFLASSQCLPQSQESGDSLNQSQEPGHSQTQVDEEAQVQELVQTGGNNNSSFAIEFLDAIYNIQIGNNPPLGEIGLPLLMTGVIFYFYFYADAVLNIQDPSSPLHFLLQYIPPSITDLLPQQVRTGPVGATLGLVLLAVGVFYTSTILYYIGYIIGKYILAKIVFPNRGGAPSGEWRSLPSAPATLDNLHQGVMKAVDKYNQLQETYREY